MAAKNRKAPVTLSGGEGRKVNLSERDRKLQAALDEALAELAAFEHEPQPLGHGKDPLAVRS